MNPAAADRNATLLSGPKTAMPADRFWIDAPSAEAIARPRSGRLNLVLPFWGGVPYTPDPPAPGNGLKVLTRAPEGEFAFASSARVERALFQPAAGGFAIGKTIWARPASVTLRGVDLPERTAWKRERSKRPHKLAFMIVARDRSDITEEMISAVGETAALSCALLTAGTRNLASFTFLL